jgi:hypothetical protein
VPRASSLKTILADDCSGQNKNNAVLRLPLWLVERGFFLKVTAVFFIWGHMKKACDWMFNIMKKKYDKSDTFNFSQLKEMLVVDGQVQVVEATPETFEGWGNVLKTFYSMFASGTIFKNHIFSCNSSASTTLSMKEWRDAKTDMQRNFIRKGTNGSNHAQLMKQEYQLEQPTEPSI